MAVNQLALALSHINKHCAIESTKIIYIILHVNDNSQQIAC